MDELKEILSRLRSFQNGSLWPINSGLAASLGGIIGDMERALKELGDSDQDRTCESPAGCKIVA